MRESMLGVSIHDGIARLGKTYLAGMGSGDRVVLVAQVYENEEQQLNLALTCAQMIYDAGVRLIALEGAAGQILPTGRQAKMKDLIHTSSVSAGVLSLLESPPVGLGEIEVWGVDDLGLIQRSNNVWKTVKGNGAIVRRTFGLLQPFLQKAQMLHYGSELAKLGLPLRSISEGRPSPTSLVPLIKVLAARSGMDLRDFPMIHRYDEIETLSARINVGRATRQRQQFIERLLASLGGWYHAKGRNQVDVDLNKALPILQYYMEATGLQPEEFEQNIQQRGIEDALLGMKDWIENWVIQEALKQIASTDTGMAPYYEELMRLALRIGVTYFDLIDFRQYVAMWRETNTLEQALETLTDEIALCSRALIEKLNSPTALELYDTEQKLETLCLALNLELSPAQAEIADLHSGSLLKLGHVLCQLANVDLPPALQNDLLTLDAILSDAREFLGLSRQRSEYMAEGVLRLMRARGEETAILVVGGFHERAITRILEDQRQVSWSVLKPNLTLVK